MGKTPNKIAYGFLSRRLLDLISLFSLPTIYIAQVDAANAIFFALANQKAYHNGKH